MILLAAHLARPGLHVGPAFPRDVGAIAELLQLARQDCIQLSPAEIARRLGEFEVARSPSGQAVGCASVHGSSARTELRCVAVHPKWRGAGAGRLLVERAVARTLAAGEELFCVSRKPAFFEGLGFTRLPAHVVPQREGVVRGGPARCALIRRHSPMPLSEACA